MVKERPILFSRPMIQALLAGRKTQTRRIIKPQREVKWFPYQEMSTGHVEGWYAHITERDTRHDQEWQSITCPYGAVGDQLWVRETFAHNPYWLEGDDPGDTPKYFYRADMPDDPTDGVWTPSIHMPRIASRLTLEITNIRVERLKDISEEDAVAEGIETERLNYDHSLVAMHLVKGSMAIDRYARLWDEINGTGAWALNPYVWAVSFKVVPQR